MPSTAFSLSTWPPSPSEIASWLVRWRQWAKAHARHVRELTDQAWEAAVIGPAEGRLGRASATLAESLQSSYEQEQELLAQDIPLCCIDCFALFRGHLLPWRQIARGLLARGWQRP